MRVFKTPKLSAIYFFFFLYTLQGRQFRTESVLKGSQMTIYTPTQINTLFLLRSRLAEKGFDIFHLKRSKYPEEFIAFRRQEAGNPEDNAFRAVPPVVLCRFFRGKVQIKFLESWHLFTGDDLTDLQKSFGDSISFTERAFNPTRGGKYKKWHELVDQEELEALI